MMYMSGFSTVKAGLHVSSLCTVCSLGQVQCNISYNVLHVSRQSKKEGKDQELIQSSTTPVPGYQWESDNLTIRHHKREPRGQPFPSR